MGLKQVNAVDGDPSLVVSVPTGAEYVTVGIVGTKQRLQWKPDDPASMLEVGSWFVAIALVLTAGLAVVRKIWNNDIDLKTVISEPDGKASLARFQALLFTFIFLIAFVLVIANTGEFPKDIPGPVLFILAGSAGTYLIAKYIGNDGSTAVIAGASSRILWAKNESASLLNDTMSPVRVRVPFGGASMSVSPRDYKVVAVVIDDVQLELGVISNSGAKGEVYYRYNGQSIKVGSERLKISGQSGKQAEIAVAFFGGSPSDAIDLEIKKV